MILNFRAHENFEFDVTALDSPAGQDVRQPLSAEDALAKILRAVAVKPAREHDFQKEAILVEAARCNDETAVGKGAVAPDVPAGKKHDVRVVRVGGVRAGGRHADTA